MKLTIVCDLRRRGSGNTCGDGKVARLRVDCVGTEVWRCHSRDRGLCVQTGYDKRAHTVFGTRFFLCKLRAVTRMHLFVTYTRACLKLP